MHSPERPRPLLIALAMASLYFFWGSTYLGIRVGVQGYEPFFLAGVRNLIAGMLLYLFTRVRGVAKPAVGDWKSSVIVGALLLVGGNGIVTYASQYLPSGFIAVLVAMLPLWMVILDSSGTNRDARVLAGVGVGFCGVILLVAPKILDAIEHPKSDSLMQGLAAGCCVVSSLSWACGSLFSRKLPKAASPLVAIRSTGMQLICGGIFLLIVSSAMGEFGRLSEEKMFASWKPTGALVYLIVFGSIVGYSSYIWLLGVIPASRVATYAYVNPVVAVFLGWLLYDEVLSARTLLAAAIIIASVAVTVSARPRSRAAATASQENACPQECS